MQLAAHVADWGGPDAVTFLRGTPVEQAVWLATAELHAQWRKDAVDRAERARTGGGDDE